MNKFLKMENKVTIKLKIIPLSPLTIKYSSNEKDTKDSKVDTYTAILTTEKNNKNGKLESESGKIKKEVRGGEIYIPGSTLKGLFRDKYSIIIKDKDYIDKLFGITNEKNQRKLIFLYRMLFYLMKNLENYFILILKRR